MGLNIKNERVHRLARLAGQRSGTTQTGAIERALERCLASIRTRSSSEPTDALDTDTLYDDAGMPR